MARAFAGGCRLSAQVRASRRYASTHYWRRDSTVRSDGCGPKVVAMGECTVY